MTEEIKYPCEQIAKNIISKFTVIPLSSMVLLLRTELREAYLAGRADTLKEKPQPKNEFFKNEEGFSNE